MGPGGPEGVWYGFCVDIGLMKSLVPKSGKYLCLMGVLFLLLHGVTVWGRSVPILKGIKVGTTASFVRIRFLFKNAVPRRTGSYWKGTSLVLLFPGARKGMKKKRLKVGKGVVKDLVIYAFPKGIKVVMNLRVRRPEYVKYQRRTPPQVVVSVKNMRSSRKLGKKSPVHRPSSRRKASPARVAVTKGKPKTGKNLEGTKGSRATSSTKVAAPKASYAKKAVSKEESADQKRKPQKAAEGKKAGETTNKTNKLILPSANDSTIYVLLKKAKRAYDQRDYRQAAKLFRRIMNKVPRTREAEESAYYWAKSLYWIGGQNPKGAIRASEAYKEILGKYAGASWEPRALMDLMSLYKTLTFYNQAIEVGRRVIEKYPESTYAEEALFLIGQLQLLKQSFSSAESVFREYLEKYPRGRFLQDVTYSLGDALYYQGDVQRAIEIYQKALTQWPQSMATNFKTLENMAAIFAKDGRYDQALDLMFTALNISSSEAQKAILMLKIGSLYERMNRCREALKIYSKIISQYPKSKQAVTATMRMADLSQRHPGIKYRGFYYGPDPYYFPLQAYNKILKEQNDPFILKKALLQKGKLLLKKDPDKAAAVFMKLVQTYPNAPEAEEGRKLLNKTLLAMVMEDVKRKRFTRCVETYRLYKKAALPVNLPLLLEVSGCYLKKGRLKEAEKILKTLETKKLRGDLKRTYDFNVLMLTILKKDYPRALMLTTKFLEAYPLAKEREKVVDSLQAFLPKMDNLKAAALISNELKEILSLVRTEREKEKVEALFVLHVKGLNMAGKKKESLALLEWYRRMFPHSPLLPYINRLLGDFAYNEGKWLLAREAYQAAMEGDFPAQDKAFLSYKVAMCYMKKKDVKMAREFLLAARKLLAKVEKGETGAQVVWLKWEIQLQLAELLVLEGKTDEAITAYQKIVKNVPPGSQRDWALYRLGVLYERKKNLKKVQGVYEALGTQAADPFWKRNAEDLKQTFGWFIRHAREFQNGMERRQ